MAKIPVSYCLFPVDNGLISYLNGTIFDFQVGQQTMPGTRRAPRKPPRAPSSTKALLQKFREAVLDLEAPLADATRLVHALRMIGDGMGWDGADEGAPLAEG